MIVDTDDILRRAVRLRALKLGENVTYSDVVNGILRGEMPPLTDEIAEVKRFPQRGTGTGKKPGRKPKEQDSAD